ncbi:MAG: Asp23/Gls24 family envelope stress response protein [Chloroflexi bacterium]|nr:Asp23/Gls24 family envelope stress response protein [Chloroflexota bacterium]MBI3764296.1 Asp23/Gls24 family envelope stress response protein [Chloroflexota bacterium]
MAGENNALGKIEISPQAIATIASQSVMQSYGVVGMAARNVVDGIANALTRDPRKGIEVRVSGDEVRIDVYVIMEFGTRITTVAGSVANAVRFNLEKNLGVNVTDVNVHVQGLRVSNPD